MRKREGLTAREKRFCGFYVSSGNCKEAAAMAGYSDPEKHGIGLLSRDDIIRETERLYSAKTKNCRQQARAGYERLAFGNVSDAVKLMFCEDPESLRPEQYDLFNVAEIKRPKDGALEIKFFDRIKALEKLECADQEERKGTSDFYRALIGSISRRENDSESGES